MTNSTSLPKFLCPRDCYVPRSQGGLGLTSLVAAFATQTINHALRYLHFPWPSPITAPIRALRHASTPSSFQCNLVDACYFLHYRIHGFGPWNPCPPHDLLTQEHIYVQLNNSRWISCSVQTPGLRPQLVENNSPCTYSLRASHNFACHDPTQSDNSPQPPQPAYLPSLPPNLTPTTLPEQFPF